QLTQQTLPKPAVARSLSNFPTADLPGSPSTPISLSNTAQLLVQLLRHFPSSPVVRQPQALLPAEPQPSAQTPGSIATPQASSAAFVPTFSSPLAMQLFQSLQRAVHQSGLFYESHLAQFATGRYSRAQLQAEPQAQLTSAAGVNLD